jgi:hypothetical protein
MSHTDLPKVGPGTSDDDEEDEKHPPTTLEYLDYRPVIEHGWDLEDDDLFEKAAEADLDDLAARTAGFVGADIEAALADVGSRGEGGDASPGSEVLGGPTSGESEATQPDGAGEGG